MSSFSVDLTLSVLVFIGFPSDGAPKSKSSSIEFFLVAGSEGIVEISDIAGGGAGVACACVFAGDSFEGS